MTKILAQSSEQLATKAMQPVVPDLFQGLDGSSDRYGLVGGHCTQCDRYFFPAPGQCPTCHDALIKTVFGERGRIYSYTVIHTKAPFSLPEPYAVGYVDLDDVPLRVFSLIDPEFITKWSVGLDVRLVAMPLGVDGRGNLCLRPVFIPVQLQTGKESL